MSLIHIRDMESSACRRRASDVEQSSWSNSMTAESGPVKEEPEWSVCGVSEAAAAEGLYADHEVKDELVFGPEVVQQQDIAFSMQNAPSGTKEGFCNPRLIGGTKTAPHTCPGDKPRCKTGVRHITPKLFSCSSCNKEFITEPFLHKHMLTHKDVILFKPTTDDVRKSKPDSYGDGTLCKRSTEQHQPGSCFVRHERLPVEHNVLSSAEQGACKLEPADEAAAESTRTQSTAMTCKHMHTGQKPHSCDTCREQLTQRGHLTRHKQTHTTEKPYCCDICNKRFTRRSGLTLHERQHTGEKPYSCDICNKRFTKRGALTIHIRRHTGEKPYGCDICNKRFTEQGGLTIHMRIHTGEKPYSCDVCNKRFLRKCQLDIHIRVHTGEKLYSCDICNKRFTQQGTLTSHIRIHTGEKPYSCDICNKRFTAKSSLAGHLRQHTGEKPYGCDICNKRFTRKCHLDIHIRVHTGEKLYICDICNKWFTQQGGLTSHIRTHTGEKPYSCDICNKRFTEKSNLARHIRQQHR